ncbi:PadR family transcriptional regulator [Leifsonia flava]|uniref:PadR family transcriptional regulator n=1 Tax=Orlajensenia leifsoniae TaxID=2561933 RepID=A0A4Y9QZW4_9MICO|nr:PadR family transcriptional regulator [Leifsonia flava]TFV96773.1 PadR family transcriptional regulator [Leifsonia flava]
MGSSFPTSGFAAGLNPENIWQKMEEFRSGFEKRTGFRAGRGDVRAAVLALLAEQPMHGYQIIREIEERSGGSWKPSAGSVYPTLQLLADEALITSEESNGRKTYALTEAGRVEAESASGSSPWGTSESSDDAGFSALPKVGVKLARVAAQVNTEGSKEQIKEAVAVLEDARRRLHLILAQD